MQAVAVVIAILVAASAFGAVRLSSRCPAGPSGGKLNAARLKSMSRQEIEKLLSRVERSPEPEPAMGAMCYDMAGPPGVAEYICPACGEKTIYSDDHTWLVAYELQSIRAMTEDAASRSGLELTLDESQFCRFCTAGDEDPQLVLEVTYEDGARSSAEVGELDIRLLSAFLSGGLSYVTETDGTEPLRPELERLREILGMAD
jgi:hypothetical protein